MQKLIQMLSKDTLVNSSAYLISASAITSVFGFVFWVISARLFSSEQVGLAASLIATMALVTTLTTFGFDMGIIRFWKQRDSKKLVASCSIIAVLASLIVSAFFVLIFSSVKFPFANHVHAAMFVLLCAVWTMFSLNDSVYVAMQSPRHVLFKQVIFSLLKLVLPFLLVSLGFFGIFGSWSVSALLALIAVLLLKPMPFTLCIDLGLIRSIFRFSLFNYLTTLFARLRELAIPLLITYLLGARQTAYYYLAFNITVVFLLVPKAVSKVLLAELSHSRKPSSLGKSFALVVLSSLAAILVVVLFGRYLLLLYGPEYAQRSLALLYIFSVSGF